MVWIYVFLVIIAFILIRIEGHLARIKDKLEEEELDEFDDVETETRHNEEN